jgi:hypothetical protein
MYHIHTNHRNRLAKVAHFLRVSLLEDKFGHVTRYPLSHSKR